MKEPGGRSRGYKEGAIRGSLERDPRGRKMGREHMGKGDER